MVKKAVDTNKSSREELFRAFQVFGIDKYLEEGSRFYLYE
jgi:hypothetical protein